MEDRWLQDATWSKIQKLVFKFKGFNPDKFVAAVFKLEGTPADVKYQKKNIILCFRDMDLG